MHMIDIKNGAIGTITESPDPYTTISSQGKIVKVSVFDDGKKVLHTVNTGTV